MSLSILTTVNNINNLSDARYCAGMGVDILGFNLTPGEYGYVTPEAVQDITGWLAGVQITGEFTNLPVEQINELAQKCALDLVQLNSNYLLDDMAKINSPIIQQININKDTVETELTEKLQLYSPYVKYFLLTSDDFLHIDETNSRFLKNLTSRFPILLGFGFTQNSVKSIIEDLKPAGIALKGGHEIKPGLKNFDELADIFEVLED